MTLAGRRTRRHCRRVRSVFVVTGAFLGRVDGETRCAFWADDPSEHGFDRQVVDALDHTVAAAFAMLAADGVFARAGIVRLRLLGCETAVGLAAQASLTRLARITGVSVLGTTRRLFAAHHGPDGFRPRFERMLVEFTPAVTRPSVRRILPAGWPSLPWGALAPSSAWRSSSVVPATAT